VLKASTISIAFNIGVSALCWPPSENNLYASQPKTALAQGLSGPPLLILGILGEGLGKGCAARFKNDASPTALPYRARSVSGYSRF